MRLRARQWSAITLSRAMVVRRARFANRRPRSSVCPSGNDRRMRRISSLLSISLVTGLLVVMAPSVAGGSETAYTFSGTTNPDNTVSAHTVTCPPGSYVRSSGTHQGTVFDRAYLDTSGTNSKVGISSSLTESTNWGQAGSKLATGITIGVDNKPNNSGKSLRFSITTECTRNTDDAWVVPSTAGVSTTYMNSLPNTWEGWTEGKTIYRTEISCPSGWYIENNGLSHESILGGPYFQNESGHGVNALFSATDSIPWGHVFSRLVTKMLIAAYYAYSNPEDHSGHYKITTKCTDSMHDAWVIVG